MPETEQGPGYGGAILAAVGDGCYKDVEEACSKIVKYDGYVDPDEKISSDYDKGYEFFVKLYPHIKDLYS